MMLSSVSRIALSLVAWLGLNLVVFVVPGLGWVQYPILLNVEILVLLFLVTSVADGRGWVSWFFCGDVRYSRLDSSDDGYDGQKPDRRPWKRAFLFAVIGVMWAAEIVLQRLLFSSVFTSVTHYVTDSGATTVNSSSDSPNDVALVCMDGTFLFGLRQTTMVAVAVFSLIVDWNTPKTDSEKSYIVKTFAPAVLLSAGAFTAVVNNPDAHIEPWQYAVTVLWVISRAARLVLIKIVQGSGMNRVPLARFIRSVAPFMLLVLVPSFFGIEFSQLREDGGLGTVWGHIARLGVYGLLFVSSWVLLMEGGNATDFTNWVMFREVVWNTSCVYVVGTGLSNLRTLSVAQILGLALFLCGWCTYTALYAMKMSTRHRMYTNYSLGEDVDSPVSPEEYLAKSIPNSQVVQMVAMGPLELEASAEEDQEKKDM